MKKPILVSLILLNLPLKALMLKAPTASWSSWFHLLVTLLEKKYLQQSRVHRNLTSFQKCPLVPLMLSSEVKSSFNLSLVNHACHSSVPWLALVAGSGANTPLTGCAGLPLSSQYGATVPRPWPALDRWGRSATTSTLRLSPTTDHAANATPHYWFIPCDGGTGMEQSSS